MLAVVCPIEGAVPERYGQLIDTVLQNAKKVSGDKKDTEAAVILRDEKDFLYWCKTQKKPGSCIVFAVHLDRSGINLRLYAILKEMDYHTDCLLGCTGAILVDGENELYTKNMAKKIAFSINRAGCMLPGHTFAEATGSLKNQTKNAMHRNLSLKEAFLPMQERRFVMHWNTQTGVLRHTQTDRHACCAFMRAINKRAIPVYSGSWYASSFPKIKL